jgi:ligand-binding sensor domain-containing protein/signal transduction histidine kinase
MAMKLVSASISAFWSQGLFLLHMHTKLSGIHRSGLWMVLGLAVSICVGLEAQPENHSDYDIRRIAVHDGMINQSVTALCQDGSGMMWVGTMDGLYTFDGVRLMRFESKKTGHDLLRMFIVYGLEADTTGLNRVLVATSQGVMVIDPIQRAVVPEVSLGLPTGFLKTCFQIEKSTGEGYWLLSKQGLYKLTNKSEKQYDNQLVVAFSGVPYSKLLADPGSTDAVWILPPDSMVYYLKNKTLQSFPIPKNKANSPPGQSLEHWMYTAKGEIVGWDHARNLYHFNRAQNRIEPTKGPRDLYSFLPMMKSVDDYMEQKTILKCVTKTLADQILLGTDLGLFMVRKKTHHYFKIVEALRGEEIRGMYADTAKRWWAGSYKGLHTGHLYQDEVKTRPKPSQIWDFLPLDSQLILLAQENPEGFAIWDVQMNKPVPDFGLRAQVRPNTSPLSGLSLCRDSQGTIWGGTYRYLLYANSQKPYQFRHWIDQKTNKALEMPFVRALIADDSSGIWAGHEKGLLRIIFNKQTNQYETIPLPSELQNVSVSDLYQDQKHRLWIATKGRGLACLDLRQPEKKLQWFDSSYGLCNDFVCRIEAGRNDGTLWISTHNGLSRFNIKNRTFQNFYEDSGFPGNEFNSAASTQFPDGTMMFGGVSGLIYFHPDSIPAIDYQHKTILSGTRYYDGDSGLMSDLMPTPSGGLSLPPYPEYFELFLGTTKFVTQNKLRYRYRLLGLSDLWTYIGGEGEVKFIRLAPGRYVFEAQSVALDGHLGAVVLLPIFVETPYYETWWFKILMVAGTMSIGFWAYRYRVRQLLYEQRMREQIADDLHDDIGNKLNLISIFAQNLLKIQPKNEPQSQELGKLIEISRNALRTLHTMLWSVDSKKDRLSSLFDRMQDFADGYLRPMNIKFKFELKQTTPDRNINLQVRHNIIMIYQELLTNMVKYTGPTHISIRVELERDTLCLNIINQHPQSSAPDFNTVSAQRGLSSIERRLNRIQGRCDWVEISDERQEIILIVPQIFKNT